METAPAMYLLQVLERDNVTSNSRIGGRDNDRVHWLVDVGLTPALVGAVYQAFVHWEVKELRTCANARNTKYSSLAFQNKNASSCFENSVSALRSEKQSGAHASRTTFTIDDHNYKWLEKCSMIDLLQRVCPSNAVLYCLYESFPPTVSVMGVALGCRYSNSMFVFLPPLN